MLGCKGTTRLPGAAKIIRKDGALFGPAKTVVPHASLKIAAERMRSEAEDDYRTKYETRLKEGLHKKGEAPVVGMRSNKNFITANAVEAILQGMYLLFPDDKPKFSAHSLFLFFVATYPCITVPKAVSAGELNYLRKEDYGKIPEYLTKVKEEIRREQDMIDKYVKEQLGEVEKEPERFDEIPEHERLDLIAALKAKWDFVNANYQKITHLVRLDTTGQVRRKEQLEAELKQLETDIERLSKAGALLIRN